MGILAIVLEQPGEAKSREPSLSKDYTGKIGKKGIYAVSTITHKRTHKFMKCPLDVSVQIHREADDARNSTHCLHLSQ